MTTLLVIIYVAFISLGLPDSLLGTAWPTMHSALGVPVSWAGVASIVVTAGTIVSSYNSARVIRRFGTGLTTAVSVLMTAVALLGISFAPGFWAILLWAVPLGLGAGSVDAGLNNFVALHYEAKHMNWLHCFWGIGVTLSPLIMSYSLAHGSWRSGYSTVGLLQAGLVIALVASLPLWRRAQGPNGQGGNVQVPPLRDLLRIPAAKSQLAAFFCYCGVEGTAGLWGGTFLVLARGIAPETAASWVSLFYLGITCGRLLSGFLAMRVSNGSLIRIGQVLIVAGVLTLFLPWTAALPAGLVTIGLGCAPIFPAMLHDTPVHFGAGLSQAMMGVQMAFAYVGGLILPPLFGYLGEQLTMGLFPPYLMTLTGLTILATEATRRTIAARGHAHA
ncbi:fucose permease [Symbiobacterium terraclitae]|uniref:Fucose permease n=1 Tax=Symbiobacterium terraclitae TaxID=557451 RepID=A0ABS4JV13_9FIRM|nr:MFS transporter [Symbiobacterium terraclitae]MBP2019355.1 fucose permease [Symbiobacterium terraclitae]